MSCTTVDELFEASNRNSAISCMSRDEIMLNIPYLTITQSFVYGSGKRKRPDTPRPMMVDQSSMYIDDSTIQLKKKRDVDLLTDNITQKFKQCTIKF